MCYLNIPYYSSLGKYCPHIAIPGLLARLTTYSCTCLFGSQSQVVSQVNMHGIASIETSGIFYVLSRYNIFLLVQQTDYEKLYFSYRSTANVEPPVYIQAYFSTLQNSVMFIS